MAKKKAKAKTTEKDYFSSWYATHKQELSDKRKKRYADDPVYRAKVNEKAKDRYRIKREESGRIGTEPEVRGYNHPKELVVGGRQIMVFCVSEFADRLGCDIQTITSWEESGIAPPPTVIDEMGRRWYSDAHIRSAEKSSKKRGFVPKEARGYNRPKRIEHNGSPTIVFSVSEFADRVGRDVQRIIAWEKEGIVPPPTHTDNLGRRWYSEFHMDTIAKVARDFRKSGGRSLVELKAAVDEAIKGGV